MKNFFLVLSHYNFIQIKVKTKKSMTLQSFNIRGWKWLSAYLRINPDWLIRKIYIKE